MSKVLFLVYKLLFLTVQLEESTISLYIYIYFFLSFSSSLSGAMPFLFRRLGLPVKLVILVSFLFLVLLLGMQYDMSSGTFSEPWLEWPPGTEVMKSAVAKYRFQIGAPLPGPSVPETILKDCPPGFYSKDELKPHLERPLQDPLAPGADGAPFVSGRLTPAELKEKQEGMAKNQFNQFASDRISLHRSLGNDTRHPEWV